MAVSGIGSYPVRVSRKMRNSKGIKLVRVSKILASKVVRVSFTYMILILILLGGSKGIKGINSSLFDTLTATHGGKLNA